MGEHQSASPASVPADLPEDVMMVDHRWLGEQAARGARLALVDEADPGCASGATEGYREELRRVVEERDALRAEVEQLEERAASRPDSNKALVAALLGMQERAAEAQTAAVRLETRVLSLKTEVNQLRLDLQDARGPRWRRKRGS